LIQRSHCRPSDGFWLGSLLFLQIFFFMNVYALLGP